MAYATLSDLTTRFGDAELLEQAGPGASRGDAEIRPSVRAVTQQAGVGLFAGLVFQWVVSPGVE